MSRKFFWRRRKLEAGIVIDEIEQLGRLVGDCYDLEAGSLFPLGLNQQQDGPRVYCIEARDGQRWVLRARRLRSHVEDVATSAAVLSFLESREFPAPRLVPAADGALVVRHGEWQALVMSFIAGPPPDYSAAGLRMLGETLGWLHSLGADTPATASPPVLPTEYRPEVKVPNAIRKLKNAASRVPGDMRGRCEAMLEALEGLHYDRDLPCSIIHTDCYPGNAIQTAPDQVMLVNWAAAGLAPSVIDLGNTLLACSTVLPWAPELGPNVPSISAIVEGYARRRVLTPAELDTLPSALRFIPAVLSAARFVEAVDSGGSEEQWKLWWARYTAAEAIAAVARGRFEAAAESSGATR